MKYTYLVVFDSVYVDTGQLLTVILSVSLSVCRDSAKTTSKAGAQMKKKGQLWYMRTCTEVWMENLHTVVEYVTFQSALFRSENNFALDIAISLAEGVP